MEKNNTRQTAECSELSVTQLIPVNVVNKQSENIFVFIKNA
jgi:hypothetical protein